MTVLTIYITEFDVNQDGPHNKHPELDLKRDDFVEILSVLFKGAMNEPY